MRLHWLAALLVVGCATANAQDWEYVTNSKDAVFLINPQRLERQADGSIKFWVKSIPADGAKTMLLDNNNPKSAKFTEGMQYLKIKCQQRLLASISLVLHDADGRVVFSEQGNEYAMRPIVPDSIGDNYRAAVCD